MIIGIVANITKDRVYEVVSALVKTLKENGFDFLLVDTLLENKDLINGKISKTKFIECSRLCKKSDMIISIGGDGTMLATAYQAQFFNKPVLGVNLGKLGFLAEVNINQMNIFIKEIKDGNYEIEERMIITAECIGHKIEKLYAVNDIVIDKGGWPKMIELEVSINNEYVTTFSADGLIVATPTGSTGYSISTGGPIVSPKTDVLTLSPISPHSLSMRPLVLPGNESIAVRVSSFHKEVFINCDGQRVFTFPPPLQIKINKSERPFRLVHTSLTSYFETLRNKLLWGIDLRTNSF
jgi:NAD+ kinase